VVDWGVSVKSVEIQDIKPSSSMQNAMEQQASAERTKRAAILEAEGRKAAVILEAEGKLEAAKKEAEAQVTLAGASAKAIENIAQAVGDKELPAMFLLGDRYVGAMQKLASAENTRRTFPADLLAAVKGMLPLNPYKPAEPIPSRMKRPLSQKGEVFLLSLVSCQQIFLKFRF
jgi:regulator of protease activity HflC (stomatin/prohibitin superfamily)